MKPIRTLRINDEHWIEIAGENGSSWHSGPGSIRNRYNHADGRYNQAASSEIAFEDFQTMTGYLVLSDMIGVAGCLQMAAHWIESARRQQGRNDAVDASAQEAAK